MQRKNQCGELLPQTFYPRLPRRAISHRRQKRTICHFEVGRPVMVALWRFWLGRSLGDQWKPILRKLDMAKETNQISSLLQEPELASVATGLRRICLQLLGGFWAHVFQSRNQGIMVCYWQTLDRFGNMGFQSKANGLLDEANCTRFSRTCVRGAVPRLACLLCWLLVVADLSFSKRITIHAGGRSRVDHGSHRFHQ
jgi:hypothetical protein